MPTGALPRPAPDRHRRRAQQRDLRHARRRARDRASSPAASSSIVRGSVTFVPVCNPLAYAHDAAHGRAQPQPPPAAHRHAAGLRGPHRPTCCARCWPSTRCCWTCTRFRSPGRPFVMRGPADNDGALEPFAPCGGRGRSWPRTWAPSRIVEGWMQRLRRRRERRRKRAAACDAAGAVAIEDPSLRRGHHRVTCARRAATASRWNAASTTTPPRPTWPAHAIRQTLALLGLAEGMRAGSRRSGPSSA
jgi:hypothetical protein